MVLATRFSGAPSYRPAAPASSSQSGRNVVLRSGVNATPAWSRVSPALVPLVLLSVVYGRTLQRSTGNYLLGGHDEVRLPRPRPRYRAPTRLPALHDAQRRRGPACAGSGSVALRANLLSSGLRRPHLHGHGQRAAAPSASADALAAGGATALGLLLPFWRYAVRRRGLHPCCTAFLVGVLACVLSLRGDGAAQLAAHRACSIFAFSFSHATSNVLLVPGLLLYLVASAARPGCSDPGSLAGLLPAAGALLALAPYAYLPWRTAVGGSTYLDSKVTDLVLVLGRGHRPPGSPGRCSRRRWSVVGGTAAPRAVEPSRCTTFGPLLLRRCGWVCSCSSAPGPRIGLMTLGLGAGHHRRSSSAYARH